MIKRATVIFGRAVLVSRGLLGMECLLDMGVNWC